MARRRGILAEIQHQIRVSERERLRADRAAAREHNRVLRELDAAELSLLRAAWSLTRDGDPTEACAAAFLDASDVALEAGEQGVQLLGGHGYMQDHPSEKWMREARVISQLWGGRALALDDLVPPLGGRAASMSFEPAPFAEEGA
jgi:alkylation response protein AidB-like acyl-CoA dehydrogenase